MQTKYSLSAIEKNLRTAEAGRAGFIGTDRRRLADILRADEKAVRRHGLTNARIARRLLALRRAGWKGLGESVEISPHLTVSVEAARGALACPFGDPGSFAKVNTTVSNRVRRRAITFSDLHIHLIAAHGFYEGRGARFRLDPERLIKTLEMDARRPRKNMTE